MLKANTYDCIIVGAGIFGITTALEMCARGHQVAVFDPGPLPHPLAASTDISKVVRMAYGSDDVYTTMAEQAYTGWLQWNEELSDTLFHEVGLVSLSSIPMSPGSYEYESYHLLLQRGYHPERLIGNAITQRFPAWKQGVYVDGFFHAQAGYAESGRVVEALIHLAKAQGVILHAGETVETLLKEGHQVTGIHTRTKNNFYAEQVVVASGAWIPLLVQDLTSILKITGHPIFHLKPADPELFTPPNFVVFSAESARTGWYGFPLHPHEQVVKIANHGVGQLLHPEQDERVVTNADIQQLRTFLATTLPALQDAPIVATRRCLYADTPDGDFWIDRHPQWAGLTVAGGDSGHAFKFAPILGGLIADTVEGKTNPWLPKFRWRDFPSQNVKKEASRYQGDI